MSTQTDLVKQFHALHVAGNPVVLFNVWDPGSARAVAAAGATAIATGSAPVALAHGYKDGENMPLAMALNNIERIIAAVDLPVTMDLEGGYGVTPEQVSETIRQAMAAGIIGYNFEDQVVGGEGLYTLADQLPRIAAARAATDKSGASGFINARTDIFLKAKPDQHTDAMLTEAIERAKAYEQAGANGYFAPGLHDEKLIGRLCESTSLPVNIIALPNVPPKARLAELGVARISYGPVPYRHMIKFVEESAAKAFA